MRLCLLCPGQASQSAGLIERLAGDALLAPHLERLLPHLPAETRAAADNAANCFLNRHAQPLVVLYGTVVAAALDKAGITAELVAGYSVGELTAHVAAGALAPVDALALASERARLMDDCSPARHGMLAIRGLSHDLVRGAADRHGAVIALDNGPEHVIVAGADTALDALETELAAAGGHMVRLPITIPAHTVWMNDAVAPFESALRASTWRSHRATVLGPIDGRALMTADAAIGHLSQQVATPLDWDRTLAIARERGADVFFELGPGSGLTQMVRERFDPVEARALDDFATMQGALDWLHRRIAA